MSMKDSSDTIGNRARDLLVCSAVSQPNASQRAPKHVTEGKIKESLEVTGVREDGVSSSLLRLRKREDTGN
jgi:hypothetical protein